MLVSTTAPSEDSRGAPESLPSFDINSHNHEEKDKQECSRALHILDWAPAPGWTAHATKDGRLYYCNHVTRSAGWLPPAEAWKTDDNSLPYGWERAIDESGRPYYINHINKTTTYETPAPINTEPLPKPEPRTVTLERSTMLGFGFVAGSEKPVIVRFVTEGGPSVDKLLPGDQILSVNGEDVKLAPREHVISLVRSCTKTVILEVCQPMVQQGIRKSTFLSATKRARLKSKPSRVRFAESVCVNGAPLFPTSAFALGDFCVPPLANVLKVFLENGQTKSFKYDAWTTVQDVVNSLQNKLCLTATEHFSLIVEHIKSLKRNKLTLLDPQESLARIASRPGAHKLRCLFRVAFVPASAAALAQKDLNALDYLYTQCCNDVIQERFAPELQYDTALRLAALHIYQHALANNMPANKMTVKIIEREFGLERFVPASILDNLKRKEVKKLIEHFLKLHSSMAGMGKQLTALQAKLHYLDIVSQLPSYGAKCFSAGPRGDAMERVILISPKFGISQITGSRHSVFQPVPIANIEDIKTVNVKTDDEVTRTVLITLQHDKMLSISLDERDAVELVLVLRGYYKLCTGINLPVDQEEPPIVEDLAPPYLAQHKVVPEKWSYIDQNSLKSVSFALQPVYQGINKKTNGLYNTVGRHSKPPFIIGYSLDSNMNSSISNRNHFGSLDVNAFDNNGSVDDRNEKAARGIEELKLLVENSERYLSEQGSLKRLKDLSEWQETSVDIDSDTDEPGQLKHSDSLLLLNKIHSNEKRPSLSHATIELLRQETLHSESDTDSLYTPHSSPKHMQSNKQESRIDNRISFGLRSPVNSTDKEEEFQEYLQRIRELRNNENNDMDSISDVYLFDSDIIDLTLIPPPITPDELDSVLPTPINIPPKSFADSLDKLNKLDILNDNQDLEEFIAKVTVPPPTQKVTPAIELTPEEIMAYIIPPPPSKESLENLVISEIEDSLALNNSCVRNEDKTDRIPEHKKNSLSQNVAEYSNFTRRSSISCCTRMNTGNSLKNTKPYVDRTNDDRVAVIQPLPRRSLDAKPPERPPKDLIKERQRSNSLTFEASKSRFAKDLPVPKVPPRNSNINQAPPYLFLPPKKHSLPPVSPSCKAPVEMELKDNKPVSDLKTEANSHVPVQRSLISEIKQSLGIKEPHILKPTRTAVSTPTSPHIGKNSQLSTVTVEIDSPGSPKHVKAPPDKLPKPRKFTNLNVTNNLSPEEPLSIDSYENRNGYSSSRENLLNKTDIAMSGLLARLEQVAAQCTAAQVHGGGKFLSEEKFQVAKEELTSQSLQLVTSSKMLVIAMSDPSLPELPENLAVCLTILRRLTELCQDLANHSTAPLQTRNLILKVHNVIAAFHHLITSNIDRSSQKSIEEHLAAQAESLANVLSTLLRSLRVFSP